MHWSLEKAQQLIKENPDMDEFICASGISPSGHIHIGNFRELITTYFVVQGLRKLGKKARFIFSWDDYDRFRKVPKNVDPSYEQYLGLPYSQIPDPYGCCESYAKHFQNGFEEAVRAFNIDVEYIYQNEEYKTGRYNEEIIHVLNKRRDIYDILMDYKTQDPSEEERASFYPAAVYCHGCGKDNTTILAYLEETNELEYECTCGFREVMDVKASDNMKLNWKIDWPMRWKFENVIFEPGGRDHSSVGGSFEVSSRISREIFGFEPPSYIAYEFIGIKGAKGKMSSSTGNLITPQELLKVYSPEIILYLFSKFKPAAGFNFGFDEEVVRNYTEFERFRKRYMKGDLGGDIMETSMELSDIARGIDDYPNFSKIAGLLPLLDFNLEALEDFLHNNDELTSLEGLKELSDKIEYWIRNWYPDKGISIRETRNDDLLAEVSSDERTWLDNLIQVLGQKRDLATDDLMGELYAITRTEDPKETKANQKRFFRLLYQLLIDRNQGPRLPLLMKVVGVERTMELLGN